MESDLSSDDEVTTIGAGDSDVEQINSERSMGLFLQMSTQSVFFLGDGSPRTICNAK